MPTATRPSPASHVSGIVVTPRDLSEALGDVLGRRPTPEETRGFQAYITRGFQAWVEAVAHRYADNYI